MKCSDVHDAILEALHQRPAAGGTSPALADRLPAPAREHVASCAACQGFMAEQVRLDDQFEAALRLAPLPETFTTELWQRIETLPAPLPPEELTRKRQLIETEYAAALKAARSAIWRDVIRRGPPAFLATLAFALAVWFGNFTLRHSAMLRGDFGDWLGIALLAAAAGLVAAVLIGAALWLTRFAVRTPVIDEA